MNSILSLSNKTILILGATSSIGCAIAKEAAKLGARLLLVGRNQTKLYDLYQCLVGCNHKVIVCDCGKANNIDNLINEMPPIDGLVNCIGATSVGLLKYVQDQQIYNMFDTNIIIPIKIISRCIRENKLQNNGSIVLLSSVAGTRCTHLGGTIYSATKAAIVGFGKGLALELANKNIRTNVILLALIKTSTLDENLSPEQSDQAQKSYPLSRLGHPVDAAYATVFLLSDLSSWITGTEILIDGGYTLH